MGGTTESIGPPGKAMGERRTEGRSPEKLRCSVDNQSSYSLRGIEYETRLPKLRVDVSDPDS